MKYRKEYLAVSIFIFFVASLCVPGITAYGQDKKPWEIPSMDRLGDHDPAYDSVDTPTAGHPTRNSIVEPVPDMQLSDPGTGPAPVDSAYPRSGIVPCSGPDCTISDLLVLGANIFTFLVTLVGILAIAALVFAGFLYMTAAGNEAQIARAKQVATWAIVGLVLALFSVVLIQFILQALGDSEGLSDKVFE